LPQAKSFLGRGWAFPVRLHDKEAAIRLVEYETDVQQSIWIILSTRKGERVMRPDFGCGIHDLVFEAVNTMTLASIEDQVREALATFEPRIDVARVHADATAGIEGKLEISIDYTIRGTNNQLNFVYPFYITERG
jgi:phage baseplate assembly protein W